MRKRLLILLPIFLVGLLLRFLYYPQNTYFGFDQARDAYAVREILDGHLKIVGPPTANGIFHHGVLYYYIFAPLYYFSGGDPAAVSFFLRVLNASGVFILYPLVFVMFGEIAAIFASLLFAVSYEQTQFSLFLNHPSLAVISVLIFYLGLTYWIFRKKVWGLYVALLGLGLSIQFEFVETQLIPIFILFALIFKKYVPKISIKSLSIGFLAFLLPISSYLISEAVHNFSVIKQAYGLVFNQPQTSGFTAANLSNLFFVVNRHIYDNFAANNIVVLILGLVLFMIFVKLIIRGTYRKQVIFISLWFFGGLLVYLFTNNNAYFYNTGTSIALLIFVSYLLSKLYSKNLLLTIFLIVLILISNMYLITKNNPLGPNEKINPQKGLLLKDEERVVDFIYGQAKGSEFAVNALTMPYNINTTWSYLFEWYGSKKYGYVPIWGGDAAEGYPGGIKVEKARSKLPTKRFLIIEPLEGIPSYLVDSFIKNEENFAVVSEKKQIGTLQVWVEEVKE